MGKGIWAFSKTFLCKCLCKDPCSLWEEFSMSTSNLAITSLVALPTAEWAFPVGGFVFPYQLRQKGPTTGTAHKLTPTLPMSPQFPKIPPTPKYIPRISRMIFKHNSINYSKVWSAPLHAALGWKEWDHPAVWSWVCHIFYIKRSRHLHCVKMRDRNNFGLKARSSAGNQHDCWL